MCTITGVVFYREPRPDDISKIHRILKLSSSRGQDSAGIIARHPDGKVESQFSDNVDNLNIGSLTLVKGSVLIANNRAQPIPEGDSMVEENRQPIIARDWAVTHNGTIANDKEIISKYNLSTRTQIDSEVLPLLFDMSEPGTSGEINKITKQIVGGVAALLLNLKTGKLVILKNFKTLFCSYQDGLLIINSEEENFPEPRFPVETIFEVPAFSGAIIDIVHPEFNFFPLGFSTWSHLPRKENKALVVCSGGIDSVTAAYIAKKVHNKGVTLLHFDYGQKSYQKELEAVANCAGELGADYKDINLRGLLKNSPLTDNIIEIPLGIRSVESTLCWVPARNLIMLSIAAGIAESEGYSSIYSGFNLEESGSYPDNDIEFFRKFNDILNYGTITRVRMRMALERLMKPEIIQLGNYLGVPYGRTWSCDDGKELPCGQCGCCWTRQFAFKKANIKDTQTYLNKPTEEPVWIESGWTIRDNSLEELLRRISDE